MNRFIVMNFRLKEQLLTRLLQHQRWMPFAATVSMLSLVVPILPAAAFPSFILIRDRDYAICAEQLVNAGVSPELASQGCATASRPRNIGYCVSMIQRGVTNLTIEDIFSSCVQVRRPDELANCVVNISNNTNEAEPLNVLDSCRRSLLPEKFSYCVVGLRNEASGITVTQLLETCLNPPEDLGKAEQGNRIELRLNPSENNQ